MYTLEDIYDQAMSSNSAAKLKGVNYTSLFHSGVKMTRYEEGDEKYIFENIGAGGNYYVTLKQSEIDVFLNEGWNKGCYNIALKNFSKQLKSLNRLIERASTEDKNQKMLDAYKERIEKVTTKINRIKSKL